MTKKTMITNPLPPSHPFNETHCRLAGEMKTAGLRWTPQVGHYVWDNTGVINYPSPFPNRIYFVLNIQRFLDIFQTIDSMIGDLVWLPNWHQARDVCKDLQIDDKYIMEKCFRQSGFEKEKDLETIYRIILSALVK
jgi:hypothetical protein